MRTYRTKNMLKSPSPGPTVNFRYTTGSCKTASKKHVTEIIVQIGSLLEEVEEINCPLTILPGGEHNCQRRPLPRL